MNLDFNFWLSPWILGLVGLCIGSFLNVVIHRVPLILERQWMADASAQLGDAGELSRATGLPSEPAEQLAATARALHERIEKLPKLGIALPRSRCPHCGHQPVSYTHLTLPTICSV